MASAIPSPGSPTQTGRSGCWPNTFRSWPVSSEPGGAQTANSKTFAFGPLRPGASTEAIWKLTAVKAGHYTVLYRINSGLDGVAKTQTAGGVAAGGSFVVGISSVPPNTIVTNNGEVVEIGKQGHRGQ